MEAAFLKLVNMSIPASWLIVAVIMLRFLLIKAPKYIRCILWELVVFFKMSQMTRKGLIIALSGHFDVTLGL